MDKIKSKLDITDFKIRATYGTAGNNRISPYLFLPTYSATAGYGNYGVPQYGYAPATFANQNLKWETTISRR